MGGSFIQQCKNTTQQSNITFQRKLFGFTSYLTCNMPNEDKLFSRESDSTTTHVRSSVCLTVWLSVTKTCKQLKIIHFTLPQHSPHLTPEQTTFHTPSQYNITTQHHNTTSQHNITKHHNITTQHTTQHHNITHNITHNVMLL